MQDEKGHPREVAATSLHTPQASNRLNWVDLSKGIGILLVVWGHVNIGLFSADIYTDEGFYNAAHKFVYLWHMPLFFFLSGFFLVKSLERGGVIKFVRTRLVSLLYPAVIWSWVLYVVVTVAGSSVNTPTSWEDFPIIPLPPISLYWFLWALFNSSLLVMLVWVVPMPKKVKHFLLGLMAIAFWVVEIHLFEASPEIYIWIGSILEHFPYLVSGVLFAAYKEKSFRLGTNFGLAALLIFVLFALNAELFFGVTLLDRWVGLIMTLCVVIILAMFAAGGAEGKLNRGLEFLGRHSMSIYLMHVIFAASSRVALMKLGVTSMLVHFLVGCIIGIVGPLLVELGATKLRANKLIGV